MKKKLPKKIIATIDATHSGLVNGNWFMYMPTGMAAGQDSFTKPYKKPVTDGHPKFYENETSTPVVGRVIDAEYISYNLHPEMETMDTRDEKMVDAAQEVYKLQLKDSEFKGLGHTRVKAEITDEKAIQEIIDGRKLTVSIGAYLDNARCSVCGSRYGSCEHDIANSYDGKVAFRVGGKMKFDHLAFVKTPADQNAFVNNIEIKDGEDESYAIMVYDEVNIVGYVEVKTLKEIFIDSFNKMLSEAKDNRVVKPEVLDSFNESAGKGRQHSFLFSDTKEVYLKDNLGLLAAKIIADGIEETEENKEELKTIKKVIDTLVAARKIEVSEDKSIQDHFNDLTVEVIEDSKEESEPEANQTETLPIIDKTTIDSIADAVYSRIKQGLPQVDQYTADRVKTLELAVLELEDKLGEQEAELVVFAKKMKKEVSDSSEARDFFLRLEDSVNVEVNSEELEKLPTMDNIVPEEQKIENLPVSDSDEVFDTKIVAETYRMLLKDKGFKDAKAYIKDLRLKNKIPENFKF